jgi:DNA-binding beta-propeller fold protein YncE
MHMRHVSAWAVALTTVLALGSVSAAGARYAVVKEIPIGGRGGWDYIVADAGAHRLYVSHGTHIVVVDPDRGTVVGDIPDTQGVHGIALAPDLGLGFTSNGRANTSTIVELATLKAVGTVKTGENPDAILYEPSHHEVYTFNGRSGSATVFSAKGAAVVATIPLAGKPEAAVFDAGPGRIYVNIEDTSELAAIDPSSHTVAARWRLAGCEEPSGLALDAEHHRTYSVCDNGVMVALDTTTGRVVGSAPIGKHPDGAAFDPATGDIFSSNGEGTLTVARWENDALAVVQTVKTQPSARTIALDPETHRIFLPAATVLPSMGGPRPQVVADTFKVLVVARAE